MDAPQIEVMVLVRATWTPDLTNDVDYPTIEDYAGRIRHQFTVNPMEALKKLPDPRVVKTSVSIIKRHINGSYEVEGTVLTDD